MTISYNEQPVNSGDTTKTGSRIKINMGSTQLVYMISVFCDIDEDDSIIVNNVVLL